MKQNKCEVKFCFYPNLVFNNPQYPPLSHAWIDSLQKHKSKIMKTWILTQRSPWFSVKIFGVCKKEIVMSNSCLEIEVRHFRD